MEGTGFEPSVPHQEKWSMPSSSDQTRVGRTLTLEGAESSLEDKDIELSVSPKDIRISPYDLCANRSDRRNLGRGTDGSNPVPSSGESYSKPRRRRGSVPGKPLIIQFGSPVEQARFICAFGTSERAHADLLA